MNYGRLLALLTSIVLAGCQYSYGVKVEPGTALENDGVEALLDHCTGTIGCNGTYTLRYLKRLPKQILEHLSFTTILNGEEIHMQQTFALDYAYHGSFWDALMGI